MKEVRGLTWNGEDLEVFDFFVCLLWFFLFVCLTELYLFSKGPALKSSSRSTELRGEKSRLEPYSHNVPGNMFSIRS